MKRVAVFLAVVSLFLFGFGFGVNAQPPREPAASESMRQQTTPASDHILRELRQIRSRARGVNLCKTATESIDKLSTCLLKLTKFAEATQDQLTDLDRFVTQFFRCTSYAQVTQYGDPLGTQGFVYDPGTGVTFRTTALDRTTDITTEQFLNYYVVRPTANCIEFSQ